MGRGRQPSRKKVNRKGKGTGPRGKQPLRYGEIRAMGRLQEAIDELGSEHPIIQQCTEILLQIARGEITGRYVGDRYRAVVRLLDDYRGKPRERPAAEPDDDAGRDIEFVFEGVQGVGLDD